MVGIVSSHLTAQRRYVAQSGIRFGQSGDDPSPPLNEAKKPISQLSGRELVTILTKSELTEEKRAIVERLLGHKYEKGEGLPYNVTEAKRYLLSAADAGNASAQYDVGQRYALGQTFNKDLDSAERYLTQAVEQGHVKASLMLGQLLVERHMPESESSFLSRAVGGVTSELTSLVSHAPKLTSVFFKKSKHKKVAKEAAKLADSGLKSTKNKKTANKPKTKRKKPLAFQSDHQRNAIKKAYAAFEMARVLGENDPKIQAFDYDTVLAEIKQCFSEQEQIELQQFAFDKLKPFLTA